MNDDIDASAISKYLETQSDFDLEQFVYHSLLERGIQATHGGTYVDPVTKKFRQYDIRATRAYQNDCAISMAIECKNLTLEFPLIVLRVPRPDTESAHAVIRSSADSVRGAVLMMLRRDDGRGIYRKGEMVGKKATQIRWDSPKHNSFISGDADSYDKWSQALSSATDLVEKAQLAHRRYGTEEFVTFVIPILVVSDGTLWVADYSEAGQHQGSPVQTEEATLFVDRVYERTLFQDYYIGHLHVFTRTGFLKFLDVLSPPEGRFRDQVFGFVQRM